MPELPRRRSPNDGLSLEELPGQSKPNLGALLGNLVPHGLLFRRHVVGERVELLLYTTELVIRIEFDVLFGEESLLHQGVSHLTGLLAPALPEAELLRRDLHQRLRHRALAIRGH